MNNPWVIGIICAVIGIPIYTVLVWILRWFVTSPIPITKNKAWVIIFSVFVSTLVFSFGNILQAIMEDIIEGTTNFTRGLRMLREDVPGLLVLLFFANGLLPGIITGLICIRGRSLKQRILFAGIAAVISLSVFDTLIFLAIWKLTLGLELSPEMPKVSSVINFASYYFSLVCNLLGGGIVAGIIMGSVTHLFIEATSSELSDYRSN